MKSILISYSMHSNFDWKIKGEIGKFSKPSPKSLGYFCSLQRVLDVSICEPFRELKVVSIVLLLKYTFLF